MVSVPVPPAPPSPGRDVRSALPRPDRHVPKCGPVRPSRVAKWRVASLVAVHVLIGIHFAHWALTGNSLSPVEPSEAMQTLETGRVNAGFLAFVVMIASTLLVGRFACGWACHLVALQDLCAWLLARFGLRPRPVRSRLLVLAPFAVAFYMFVWPAVDRWKEGKPQVPEWQWHLYSSDLWQTFPRWVMAPVSVLVVGFLIVWWLGAKGFCTHGCPYGAVFSLADRLSPLRIVVTDACSGCGHCTNVCTSNVRVHEEVAKHGRIVDPGCMKCLDCISVCPKDALHFAVAVPKPFVRSQQRIAARADFTWPEEIALAAVAIVATQWTFRGAWFGEGIPLLLAVALGVITAVFTLLGWRLVRRPEVTFQHTVLKRAGRWTRAGAWAAAATAVWLLFSAHTFTAQRWKSAAIGRATAPLELVFFRREPMTDGERQSARAGAGEALAGVDGALGFDLVADPELLEFRGLLLHVLDRHREAEASLLAALGGREGLAQPTGNLILARYCMDPARQRFDLAERLLRFTIQHHPGNAAAENLLRQLLARPK